jgi:hypothetical protein
MPVELQELDPLVSSTTTNRRRLVFLKQLFMMMTAMNQNPRLMLACSVVDLTCDA